MVHQFYLVLTWHILSCSLPYEPRRRASTAPPTIAARCENTLAARPVNEAPVTTAAPTPALEATSDMAQIPDPAIQAPPAQSAAAAARPTLRGQIADNPLLSFLGALIVMLLTAAVASPHLRINDTNDRLDRIEDAIGRLNNKIDTEIGRLDNKIDRLNNKIDTQIDRLNNKIDTKFDQLDNKIDTKFDELDNKIDQLDDRIDRIELKLAELITALQTSGVIASAAPG